jgi:hypothetical protein
MDMISNAQWETINSCIILFGNPPKGMSFSHRSDRPCGPPSLLSNGYRGDLPGGKAAGV